MNVSHSIVVGGTKGIGRVLVERLLADGHRVTALGRNRPEELVGNPSFTFVQADLSSASSVDSAIERLNSLEAPNALIFVQRWRGEGDSWQGEIETSLNATRKIIEALQGRFSETGNKAIVLVGSAVANVIAENQPLSYHVAKTALVQFARFYAVRLGPLGIRVNCVSPGTVIKPESESYYAANQPLKELYKDCAPLGRLIEASEVADLIEFLIGNKSTSITGQNITIDGGFSLLSQESLARHVAEL